MASKTQNGTRRGRATPQVELVVRRGALRRFDRLKQATAELPVTVSWDRRATERRGPPSEDGDALVERRRQDRRQRAPFTWDTADFLVVDRAPARRRARAAGR